MTSADTATATCLPRAIRLAIWWTISAVSRTHLRLQRAYILGHSYGGLVALRYAALHPQRVDKLIIADTAVPSLQPMGARDGLLGEWREALRQKGLDVPDEKAEDVVLFDGANVEAARAPLARHGVTACHGTTLTSGAHDFHWLRSIARIPS